MRGLDFIALIHVYTPCNCIIDTGDTELKCIHYSSYNVQNLTLSMQVSLLTAIVGQHIHR